MFETWVLVLGLLLWAFQYIVAHEARTLTAGPMRKLFPKGSILPLAWHGGIWYDFFLSFWLAYLVAHHPEWIGWQWALALVVGFLASWYMHVYVYAPATAPNPDPKVIVTEEAHVQRGHITLVGWLHAAFFGLMFGIVILEYVFSKRPSAAELAATSAFLVGLLFVGNHMVLGLVKRWTGGKPTDYRGEPLKSAIGWATIVGGAIFAVLFTLARVNGLW